MSNLDYYPHKEQMLQLEENFKPLSRRSWGRDIKNLYQTRCLISGEEITGPSLVSHHIFSFKDHKILEFSLLNGFPLRSDLHKELHSKCGLKTNAKQLIQYIKILEKDKKYFINNRADALIEWVQFLECEIQQKYKI